MGLLCNVVSSQHSEETLARKAQSISYKFKLFLIHAVTVNDIVSLFGRKDKRANVSYAHEILGFLGVREVAVPFS